ncbi:MAG: permease, partial [Treponema sp.]|nr:permease [Treponema sp.]
MMQFIQEQIFGMRWLNTAVSLLLKTLGISTESKLGGSLRFFLYDSIKITLLLSVLIFAISYIQSCFPPERSRRLMSRFTGLGARIVAALLGTVTPFCSCSSIPIFMGFTQAGLPL